MGTPTENHRSSKEMEEGSNIQITQGKVVQASKEEKENLAWSTKKIKWVSEVSTANRETEQEDRECMEGHKKYCDREVRRKYSVKESLIGTCSNVRMEEDAEKEDGEISDDDIEEECEDKHWFSRGMTKEEKHEARRPWRLSLIIKLVGMTIDYHYLLSRIQAMWRLQHNFSLIDLTNGFFIVKFSQKSDYDMALLNGP